MSSHELQARALVALLAGCAVWWSCSDKSATGPQDDPPDNSTPTLAAVTVTPSSALLQALGETMQFTAAAQDDDGKAMSGKTFTWGSSNENVASVTSAGLVTAVASGTATITATTDDVEGSAAVTVEIPPSGGLRFLAITVGRNPDPDGYTLTVDGVLTQAVDPVDTVIVGDLDLGTYSATIEGLTANCYRFSDRPVSGTVVAGDTIDVLLGVECLDFPDSLSLTYTRANLAAPDRRLVGQPAAGGLPEYLTFRPFDDRAPDWSPDGSRLAFTRDYRIHVVNGDGTGLFSFGDAGLALGKGTNADWSPDGTKIAFDNDSDVYVYDLGGAGDPVNLGAGYQPAWSPDGSKIAVEFYDPAVAEPEIIVMNADGTGRVNITQSPYFLDREPTWSPDGTQIAFRRLDRDDRNGYELWVMDADGGNQAKLLELTGAQLLPVWLSDNRILFSSEGYGTGHKILVLDLDAGGTVTQLTFESGYGHDWPTGRPAP